MDQENRDFYVIGLQKIMGLRKWAVSEGSQHGVSGTLGCHSYRPLLSPPIHTAAGQHPPKSKHPKEQGENRIKPTNKKVNPKVPKVKDRDAADSTPKSQSIMMQVTEKGHFQRPAATLSLAAGQPVELRCKGSKIGWSYPAYLETFKDSRLR